MTGHMMTGHAPRLCLGCPERDSSTQGFDRLPSSRRCGSGAGIPAGRVRLRTPGSVARSYPTAPDASKGLVPTTSGVAYSASATPRGTDHAARTRVSESLRVTSGFAVQRRAPNGRRQPASPRPRPAVNAASARDVPGRRTLPQRSRPRSQHEFSVSLCLWQASYLRVCLTRRS
jgi:hypothetical protein